MFAGCRETDSTNAILAMAVFQIDQVLEVLCGSVKCSVMGVGVRRAHLYVLRPLVETLHSNAWLHAVQLYRGEVLVKCKL